MNTKWSQQEVERILSGKPGTVYQESSAEYQQMFREWLQGLLKSVDVTVRFTKADGDERTMLCTLRPEALPALVTESRVNTRPDSPTAQSVWCIDRQAWRSFRFDRILEISFDL